MSQNNRNKTAAGRLLKGILQSLWALLKTSALWLLSLLVLIFASVLWIAGTETGTRLSLDVASQFVDELSYEQLHGRWLGPLTLSQLQVRDAALELHLQQLQLHWQPTELANKHLHISTLHIDGLQLLLPPSEPEPDSEPFQLPEQLELPITAEIESLKVSNLSIGTLGQAATPEQTAAEPLIIDHAELSAQLDNNGLQLRQLAVHSPLFQADGNGNVGLIQGSNSELNLKLQAKPAQLPTLISTARIHGPVEHLQLQVEAQAPYSINLKAHLHELLTQPSWQLTLSAPTRALNSMDSSWPAAQTQLQLNAKGTFEQANFQLALGYKDQTIGDWQAQLQGQADKQQLQLTQLQAQQNNQAKTIHGHGYFFWQAPTTEKQLQLLLNWQQLQLPEQLHSPQGALDINGSLNKLTLALKTALGQTSTKANIPLQLSGDIILESPEPDATGGPVFDLTLAWQKLLWPLQQPQFSSPAGQLTLNGPLNALAIKANAGMGPKGQLTLAATLNASVANLPLQAKADWQQLHWPMLEDPQMISKQGQLDISGDLNQLVIQLENQLQQHQRQDAQLTFNGKLTDLAHQANIQATVAWQQLGWPLLAPADVQLSQGQLSLNGDLDNYQVKGNTRLSLPGQENGNWRLAGRGNSQQLQLNQIQGQWLNGDLDGELELRWLPTLELLMNLSGKELNPAALDPQLPGKLQLKLQVRADQKTGPLVAQIPTLQLRGHFRGQPLKLDAKAKLHSQAEQLQLLPSTLKLALGNNHINAKAQLNQQLQLQWDINAPKLDQLWPDLAGQLQGKGQLTGQLDALTGHATLSGKQLRFAEHQISTLTLQSQLAQAKNSQLQLQLTDLNLAGQPFKTLQVKASGQAKQHQLSLQANGPTATLNWQLQGQLQDKDQGWQGQLTRADWQLADTNPWRLKDAVAIQAGANGQVEQLCWQRPAPDSATGQWCTSAHWSNQNWQISSKLNHFALNQLQSWLPPELKLAGTVGLDAELQGQAQQPPTGTIELFSADGSVQRANYQLAYENLQTTVALAQGQLQAKLMAELPSQTNAPAAQLAGHWQQPLNNNAGHGQLTLQDWDLSWLPAVAPELASSAGSLQLQANWAKGASQPDVLINIDQFQADVPATAVIYQLPNAQFNWRSDGHLELNAQLLAGDGQLQITGTGLLNQQQQRLQLAIDGEQFLLTNSLEARALISPQLQIALQDQQLNIDGTLTIPEAEIKPQELPSGATSASSDQIIVDDKHQAPAASPLQTHSRLRIVLGDQVRFEGLGLKARFAGQLAIEQKNQQDATAVGEIQIPEGTYKAYGQDLTIERGQLIYSGGSIGRPGLDMLAVRRPRDDIEVGVNVRGTIDQPQLTLVSSPPMPQATTLSYLVLGKPPGESSKGENQNLTLAALRLGLGQGEKLAREWGKELGFDQVGIENNEGNLQQAAFVLGRYLTPQLYVSYAIGILDAQQQFRMRYDLLPNLQLQTVTSRQSNSVDVFYSLERD